MSFEILLINFSTEVIGVPEILLEKLDFDLCFSIYVLTLSSSYLAPLKFSILISLIVLSEFISLINTLLDLIQ